MSDFFIGISGSIGQAVSIEIIKRDPIALLGEEYYLSKKLEKLGLKAQKTLKDMNETDF